MVNEDVEVERYFGEIESKKIKRRLFTRDDMYKAFKHGLVFKLSEENDKDINGDVDIDSLPFTEWMNMAYPNHK
jgi:hypothetical protein